MRPSELYHCTTPKKAARYNQTGYIMAPVRGFDTIAAALAWCSKTQRTVIYKIKTNSETLHKLPDHHNIFGKAWWIDENVSNYECVFSAGKDA